MPGEKPLGTKERHPRSPGNDDDDVVLCRIRTVFQVLVKQRFLGRSVTSPGRARGLNH